MSGSNHKQLSLRVIQLTDPHIGDSPDFVLAGVNTLQSLNTVLAKLEQLDGQPELLAVTGDIAADGDALAYQQFSSAMESMQVPYAWLPGNHDNFDVMSGQFVAQPFREVVALNGWRLVFLISSAEGQVGGVLADGQLAIIRSLVEDADDSPIALFMHHPPSGVGSDWLDMQRISNSEQLATLVERSDKIKAIFAGHVHQESVSSWFGASVYTAPSTCVQFARNSTEFALCQNGPGYRWIEFFDDGSLATGVEYVNTEKQKVDAGCKGY